MTEKELWALFCADNPEYENSKYEAWCFGSNEPDLLASLVMQGVKTATASALPFYEAENCPLPRRGDLNIILDTKGNALCVIRDISVRVLPFCKVDSQQAYKEGEGDRSLEFWRAAHEQAFRSELTEIDYEFSEEMGVVCEEFEKIFEAPKIN